MGLSKGSFANLQDLVSGGSGENASAWNPSAGSGAGGLEGSLDRRRRDITVPTVGEADTPIVDSEKRRLVLVANRLPLRMTPEKSGGSPGGFGSGWRFDWDEEALLSHVQEAVRTAPVSPEEDPIASGLYNDTEDMAAGVDNDFDTAAASLRRWNWEVVFVGALSEEIGDDPVEQEAVTEELWERFRCAPVFLGKALVDRFYIGACKGLLWPLFHYRIPFTVNQLRFSADVWAGYLQFYFGLLDKSSGLPNLPALVKEAMLNMVAQANKAFADRVMSLLAPQTDYVWVHDYHLLALPHFIRHRLYHARIGFFLHCPFPSSEVFRTLPVRDEILRSMLAADVVGFHTFDYARHFLSCCSRLLSLEFESRRGAITLNHFGRRILVRILPVGVHCGRLREGMKWAETQWRLGELKAQFAERVLFVGVDDLDVFKGLRLKFQAFLRLLEANPEMRGRVCMVQILNKARSGSEDTEELNAALHAVAAETNKLFGGNGYTPIQLLERHVPLHERIAFFAAADCAVVTATRDGMNLVPHEYVVSRQVSAELNAEECSQDAKLASSQLVVSEFVGCSPALSGALRVNPWNVAGLADALYQAATATRADGIARHQRHWQFIRKHSVLFWGRALTLDLERQCRETAKLNCVGLGFGLRFRVVALDPNFRRIVPAEVRTKFQSSQSRFILVDYDGTLAAKSSIQAPPPADLVSLLDGLTKLANTYVAIVSGRDKRTLSEWFEEAPNVILAAEHGYFIRWCLEAGWERQIEPSLHSSDWMESAVAIMRQYCENTDGSRVEEKDTALVWHYGDADPEYGAFQAKELSEHLEAVLATDGGAEVAAAKDLIEVRPAAATKGAAVAAILSHVLNGPLKGNLTANTSTALVTQEAPPKLDSLFVLAMGDDKPDEDMFREVEELKTAGPSSLAAGIEQLSLYTCTVGQKPSFAGYYVNDPEEANALLMDISSENAPEDASMGIDAA